MAEVVELVGEVVLLELVDGVLRKLIEVTGELVEEMSVELAGKASVALLLVEVVREMLVATVEDVLMTTVEVVVVVLVEVEEVEEGTARVEVPLLVGTRDDDNEENCAVFVNNWMGVAELGVAANECSEKQ